MMHEDLKAIGEAARGLLFISETDHPLEVVELRTANIEQELKALTGEKNDAAFEIITVETFFRNMVKVYPGEPAAQVETARRFRKLQGLLADKLRDARVYRTGHIQVEAFIIGQLDDGRYGGLRTKLVET